MSLIFSLVRTLAVLTRLHEAAFEPTRAAEVAVVIVGDSNALEPLLAICHRESRCRGDVGIHAIDEHLSSRGYRSQVRLGHLRPWCQPYQSSAWATRGSWGLSAASHWEYLPPCYPPWVLDIPIVSAVVAARKYRRRCPGISWCG